VTRSPSRGPPNDAACGLVAKDERRRPAAVMAVIGVHVRAADADRLDLHEQFAGVGDGVGFIAVRERVRRGVDERFHADAYFAEKPPSTASVWPVT